MNNRFKTDFLFESLSFLAGFGSAMNIRGGIYDYNASEIPDEIATATDWIMVGQDIRDALEKAPTKLGVFLQHERQS